MGILVPGTYLSENFVWSSRFGRRPVLFTCLVIHGATALVQAISVNWIMFCILNWLKGVSQTYSVSIILGEANTTAMCQGDSPVQFGGCLDRPHKRRINPAAEGHGQGWVFCSARRHRFYLGSHVNFEKAFSAS